MSHIEQRLALFKHRGFCFYLASALLATFGNGLTYVAITWLVMGNEHQVLHITIMMACFWLPSIVIGPLAGVIVDRYSRKTLMILTNLVRFVILLFFSLSHRFIDTNSIYMLATILGLMLALFIPLSVTFIREIVPEHLRLHANATLDIAYEMGNLCGMGIGGILLHISSANSLFFINAMCFLVATVCLYCVPYTQMKGHKHFGALKEFLLGFRYLKKHKGLQLVYTLQMLLFASYMTAPILLAPFVKQTMHLDSGEYGMIEAALSLGIVFGGLFSPYFTERFGFFNTVLFELVVAGLAFYGFSHNQAFIPAMLWYAVIGFSFSIWAILITRAQSLTALAYQGRVNGLFNSLSSLVILLFYLVLGAVGEHFSLVYLYWVEVIFMALGIVVLLVYQRGSLARS